MKVFYVQPSQSKTGSVKFRMNLWGHRFKVVSSKMQTKNYKDFWPTIQTRIVALFWWFFGQCRQFFLVYNPCLFGRAEILVILGLYFGKNDDLINSFWMQLTFRKGWNPKHFYIRCQTKVFIYWIGSKCKNRFSGLISYSWLIGYSLITTFPKNKGSKYN